MASGAGPLPDGAEFVPHAAPVSEKAAPLVRGWVEGVDTCDFEIRFTYASRRVVGRGLFQNFVHTRKTPIDLIKCQLEKQWDKYLPPLPSQPEV